jgi:glycosyltransferase involved in cell wall biosynthesis
MPVFNEEKFITSSIQSILDQSFEDFELIIINDGSTDSTEKIISKFSDDRIKYYNRSSQGIADQLNFGLKVAIGFYIARMDGDDISHTDRLLKQYNYLEKHTDIDAIGTNYICINEKGASLFKKNNPQTPDECKFIAPLNTPILHPSLFIRKDILLGIGGYDKDYYVEDYELFNRMITGGYKLANLNEFLFYYRTYKDRAGSQREKKQQGLIYHYGKELLNSELINSEKKSSITYFQLALLEYYLGSIAESRKLFFTTMRINPRQIKNVLRYVPLTLLGDKIVKYLRRIRILRNVSMYINSKFGIDLKGF